jgi:SAM-dependent methyltransferase
VLDLGCNQGEVGYLIAQKAKNVVGIDYNKEAINIAAATLVLPNLSFICAEASFFLSQHKSKFDCLILSHVLEHIDEPKEFLEQYIMYFKKIYIEVPDFERSLSNNFRYDLKPNILYSDSDHVYEFTRKGLKELVSSVGLVIEFENYSYGSMRFWCFNNKFER